MKGSTRSSSLRECRLICFEKLNEELFFEINMPIREFADICSSFFNKYIDDDDDDDNCDDSESQNLTYKVPIKKSIKKNHSRHDKNHGQRKYESYSNQAKIDFLKKAAGGIVTNKPIELRKAKRAALELDISWSTAKSWVKKHDEYRLSYAKTGMTYADFLASQGEKLKIGVGRKITYGKEKEDEILSLAMAAREAREIPFTIRDLKQIAKKVIGENFKASDGWAKKFCSRNDFNLGNRFNPPKLIPK